MRRSYKEFQMHILVHFRTYIKAMKEIKRYMKLKNYGGRKYGSV